jgi:hypothetical protein
MTTVLPQPSGYWERRKDSIYLFAAREVCGRCCPNPKSVIDVGSNQTPTLEWHRGASSRLVSLDLVRPYMADGVESVVADVFAYDPGTMFDLVTCFQVLEHVPNPVAFARRLMELGDTVVVSVPFEWPKGKCAPHIHDPVDRAKMRVWFGREPVFDYVATELHKTERLIQVYRQDRAEVRPASHP